MKVAGPTTIHGSRQIGTTTRRVTAGSGPHHRSRARASQSGRCQPIPSSSRSIEATAPGTVSMSVTHTRTPESRSRRTSSSRFSSLLATTTSGSSARTAARSGFLVPRTRVVSRSVGRMHQSVAPTTAARSTETSASVSDGTSETTRRAGRGPSYVVPRSSSMPPPSPTRRKLRTDPSQTSH
ncbi:hypothetical protein NOK12_10840 [Nocardioides sp. OK12]|nr:hypothetical protein NOK12_10840 [Nocardioides sp. OK12]